MLLHIVLLALGLAALIAGGSMLVRGASALAASLRVAPVLIGLTVVAFGTSTPELVVNLAAALRGSTEIGFGNVMGSNIANIGFLLAITVVAIPLTVHRSLVIREIPMMILASLAALVLAGGAFLGEVPAGYYARGDGLMLLLLFVVFLYYTVGEALRQRDLDPGLGAGMGPGTGMDTGGAPPAAQEKRTGHIGLILAGLVALIVGGEITVRGAVGLATGLGVSEVVIGLTVIAVGTSLPELATTISAARSGQGDMAVGNIVGSNIYNLLFIWGLSVVIEPGPLPAGGGVDLLVMTGFSLVLLPLVLTQNRLSRLEGVAMLLAYAGYLGWMVTR
jgi:cation:H+ antiporter